MPVSSLTPSTDLSTPEQQAAFLTRGCVDALPDGGLISRLRERRPLRVKLGLDPTAPDLHLGHTVVLQRLRDFQDLGHTVVLIIGDMTAQVGDPSGRSKTRPPLTVSEIDAAAATYAEQAGKVLDMNRVEIRRNSEWLHMRMADLFALARTTTVGQLLQREDFSSRMAARQPVSVLELLYPLIQGFDSVAVDADVELGGTDQTFNLLLARQIQQHYGKPQQTMITMPILTGLDGTKKMSKSLGNYIGVTESADDIFGKTMSIPDALLSEWFTLLLGDIEQPDDPYIAKRTLATALADRFAGEGTGTAAAERFDAIFRKRTIPDNIPTVTVPENESGDVHLPALLADTFGMSRGQARKELAAGSIRLDGNRLTSTPLDMPASQLTGKVIQFGKRRFARLARTAEAST